LLTRQPTAQDLALYARGLERDDRHLSRLREAGQHELGAVGWIEPIPASLERRQRGDGQHRWQIREWLPGDARPLGQGLQPFEQCRRNGWPFARIARRSNGLRDDGIRYV